MVLEVTAQIETPTYLENPSAKNPWHHIRSGVTNTVRTVLALFIGQIHERLRETNEKYRNI